MLRPAKLFHSFHQLRHYVQTKVTELVVQHPPPPFLLPSSTTTNTLTTTSHFVYQPPKKPLVKGLQRQFPLVSKAYCSPTVRSFGFWSTSPLSSGFHRVGLSHIKANYHGIGLYRSYSSSTISPVFQAYSASSNGGVFSHLSPGMFASFQQNITGNKGIIKHTQPIVSQQQQQQQPCNKSSSSIHFDSNNTLHMEPTQGNVSHSMIVSITTPTTSTKDSVTAATAATAAVVETERAITTTAQLCKDDDMMVRSTMVSSTYTCFFITLDLVCMTGNDMMKSGRKPWTKETWPFLVAWKEQQQKHYEQLLQWLHPWIDKGYQVELINDSHLRLYFPTATTRQQALVWLDEFKHKLIMEYGGCPDWQLEEETVLIQEPLLPVGPDYFQGIHLFLTHIDELVENGPGFTKFGFVDGT